MAATYVRLVGARGAGGGFSSLSKVETSNCGQLGDIYNLLPMSLIPSNQSLRHQSATHSLHVRALKGMISGGQRLLHRGNPQTLFLHKVVSLQDFAIATDQSRPDADTSQMLRLAI